MQACVGIMPAMLADLPKITQFNGLNTVTDPVRLSLGWLVQADNTNISDTGAISKRDGYSLAKPGNFSSAYSTCDFSRAYFVDGSSLKDFDGNVLAALASSAPMYWAEVNENVYFNNGVDSGVIAPDHSVSAWRDAPVSYGAGFKGDDGQDLGVLYDTLPLGATVIQHWRGRMYAAQYFASENQTAVWYSEAMGFNLWNLDSNFFMVPGQVLALAPHKDALIVGTESKIYAYSGEKLELLADYGVVPGRPWDKDGERVLIWTTRGLCSALPFSNLTAEQVSLAPGVRVAGCVINKGGQKRFVASIQQGKEAFNAYP